MTLAGRLFDGASARPQPVRLTAQAGGIDLVHDDGRRERFLPGDLRWNEPLGPVRRVDLPDGRFCELPRGAGLAALLDAIGHRESALTGWHRSASRAAVALILILAAAISAYRWGLPAVAHGMAALVPAEALPVIDRQVLASLDQLVLHPSRLAAPRAEAVRAALQPVLALRGGDSPAVRIEFRAAPRIGANAFALPGGTILVTDGLLTLAPDMDHVVAVIAHELGHVDHAHGLRNLFQASLVGVAVGVWTGDFHSLAGLATTMLLGAAYSREFEIEADRYGAELLQRSGRSPALLAEMLALLEDDRGTDSADRRQQVSAGGYLSSHPPTPARIARLRALAESAR